MGKTPYSARQVLRLIVGIMTTENISPPVEWAGAARLGQTIPPHRILVVEDDLTICRLNAGVLRDSGYHVDAAEDGAVAWDTLQRTSYDLMVTDNDMPNVSGVELLHKLHAAHMVLPVIMATGTLPAGEFTRHPWLHPAAVLLKPYSFKELLGTVQQVLRSTCAARERVASQPAWQTEPSGLGLTC
jgi:DNA-binding response OmpR family regulator